MKLKLFAAILLVIGVTSLAFGQTQTGSVTGADETSISQSAAKAQAQSHNTNTNRNRNTNVAGVVSSGNSRSISGVANSGNSRSISGVADSGNSKNTVIATVSPTVNTNQTQGNSQSVGGQSVNSEYKQVRQAPAAIAPDVIPSAPCRISGGAGASSPFGGLSVGGSKLDKECDKRETARLFYEFGDSASAIEMLCQTKAAHLLNVCINLWSPAPPPPTTGYYAPPFPH